MELKRATACLQAVWGRKSWIAESPVLDSNEYVLRHCLQASSGTIRFVLTRLVKVYLRQFKALSNGGYAS